MLQVTNCKSLSKAGSSLWEEGGEGRGERGKEKEEGEEEEVEDTS